MSNYTPQQRIAMVMRQLAYIKSELHTAFNPQSLRDRMKDLVDAMEFALGGYISDGNPNQIPGVPASLLDDPTKTRVEFTSGPGAVAQAAERAAAAQRASTFTPNLPAFPTNTGAAQPTRAPGSPINNGDVQFVPGPPPGNPIGARPSGPFANGPVEPPPPPAPIFPGADYGGSPTRVEIVGGPTHRTAPLVPGAPVNNEGAQILSHGAQTRTTEAGRAVLPADGLGMGVLPPGAPQNEAEARERLASIIPLAE
jgi:hypothetical protein